MAVESMQDFLNAWIIRHDEVAALSYFGAAALETFSPVPEGADGDVWRNGSGNYIGSGYWVMLNSIWPSTNSPRDAQLGDVLAIDQDVRAFTRELSGRIVHEETFIVYAAYDDAGVHSFDAGYGDVADYLQPSRDKPALILIAGFRNPRLEDAGPLVSFWEREGDAWRIQALGAYPKY